LHGTLYSDWALTQVLNAGDVVNASSGGSATVYFRPDAEFSGTAQFGVAARDDDGAEDPMPGLATIDVYSVNDRPVVDLDSGTAGSDHAASVVTTSGDEVFISGTPLVTDVDNAHVQSATITLTNGEAGDDLITGDNPNLPGLTWEYFGTAGDIYDPLRIVFSGDAPLSVYEAAIAQLRFSTTSPVGGDRIIEVVVNDGTDASDPAISTITVQGTANFAVTTDTGYDASTFYAAINDADVTSNYDASSFVAVGTTLPYAFRVHGYDFVYSGPVDQPDVDSGTITGIEILTNALDPLAEISGINIDIAQLDAALTQFGNSGGTDTTLLDAIFRSVPYVATGNAGRDVLIGGRLADAIHGGGGNDVLGGGADADLLDGGAGNDIASYLNATSAVTADLLTPANNTNSAAGDTYVSIEGLRGSSGFNDQLFGDDNNNSLDGSGGADLLDGRDGFDYARYTSATAGLTASLLNPAANTGDAAGDTYVSIEGLWGSNFNDVLTGDNANNNLDGSGGADVLDGQGGFDRARYASSRSGLTASLADQSQNTGDAVGDTYISIEGLIGSNFNDVLIGDGANNALRGDGGADVLNGGAGFDAADYSQSSSGLTVDLTTPANNTGEATGDTFISIENIVGSAFADTLRGDGNNNLLDGGDGADLLEGGSGIDYAWYNSSPVGVMASLANPGINTGYAIGDVYVSIEGLVGSSFNDFLIGDGGTNRLRGGAGADQLDGGGGFDVADYFNSSTGLVVDMMNPNNNTGEAAGDTYASIESIRGSTFNDTLRADNGGRILEGGLGEDALVGGAGYDFAAYWSSSSGVTANLADPSQNTGEALGDTYSLIEGLIGSTSADTLVGNASNNVLRGSVGGDVLDGGDGIDTADYSNTLFFPTGIGVTADLANSANNTGDAAGDTYVSIENLTGSQYNDQLHGNSGNNTLTGGTGSDLFVFKLGDGHDVISDFIQGQDKVDLTIGLSEAALQTLINSMSGTDLVFVSGEILTFTGVSVNTLNAHNDFVLH
jgi:Ca2+-binding RTX toxin-like protein